MRKNPILQMPKETWNTCNFWAFQGVSIRYFPYCRNKKLLNGLWSQSPLTFQPLSTLGLCRGCKVPPNQHSCNGVRHNMGKWGRRALPMWWINWVQCKWEHQDSGEKKTLEWERPVHTARGCRTPASTPEIHFPWISSFFFFKLKIPRLTHFPVILVKKACRGF